MPTSSFTKLATATASVLRNPEIVDGKRGPKVVVMTIEVTPPDTMDATIGFGFGLSYPHSMWTIYYEGSADLQYGDEYIIAGIHYKTKNIRTFPNYRSVGNTSYEIVLEALESEVKN